MSRTVETINKEQPCKVFVFFNGQEGKFSYIRDGGDMVPLAFPLTFVVLDCDAFSIGGKLNLNSDSPRWKSNIGHPNHKTDLRVVLSSESSKVVAEGKWADIKGNPALTSAKWQRHIFALMDVGNGKELCRIDLKGKALFEWTVFAKDTDPCGNWAIQVKEVKSTPSKVGPASFVPVFSKLEKVSAETLELATKMDAEVLQPWFNEYFGSGAKVVDTPGEVDEDSGDDPSFEAKSVEVPNKTPESGAPPADDSDTLPF